MAGYKGYSMSNNAVEAYESGERPISQWTKAAFTEEIEAMTGESEEAVKAALKPYTTAQLRSQLLVLSSWHHTSCRYNRTNFYFVEDLETLQGVKDRLSGKEEEDKLARLQAADDAFKRVEAKYAGKMPLDQEAVKKIWRYCEESFREGNEESQGFNWLFAVYESAPEIEKHADEIDALNWVPADRRRFMRILTLDIR